MSLARPGEPGRLDVGLAADDQLRWTAVELTPVIEEARRRLDLAPIPAIAFGRCAAAAAMLMRISIKVPLRLEVDVRGDGPLGRVNVEVGLGGDLRGLVAANHAVGAGGPRDLRVGPAIGKGMLRVRREDPGGRSYMSQVELVTGEIGSDVAHFLAQSEQRRSAVLLGVLVDPGGVTAAGGLIVEALPRAEPEVLDELERRIAGLGSISRSLKAGGLEHTVHDLLGAHSPVLVETQPVRYRCRCDRDRITSQLESLERDELFDLVGHDGTLDAECAFCGTVYRIRLDEVLPS